MPRQRRSVIPQWPAHIVQRGNDRMVCFRDENDYLVYLALLRHIALTVRCAVHAYCLMSNHIHLLVTPATHDSCSNLMKGLAQRYSYYFNQKYARSGPLWEGRFRSSVVESSRYVLACYRYIELNPVRAGMVKHPQAYAWSSYAFNSGIRSDQLIHPHEEIVAIGTSAYVRLLEETLTADELSEIREATGAGYPLNGRSVSSMRRKVGRPRKEEKSVSDTDLFSGDGVS